MKKLFFVSIFILLISCSKNEPEKFKPGIICFTHFTHYPETVVDYVEKNYGQVSEQCWYICEYDAENNEVCRTRYELDETFEKTVWKESHQDAVCCTVCLSTKYDGGIIEYYAYYLKAIIYGKNTDWILEPNFWWWSLSPRF